MVFSQHLRETTRAIGFLFVLCGDRPSWFTNLKKGITVIPFGIEPWICEVLQQYPSDYQRTYACWPAPPDWREATLHFVSKIMASSNNGPAILDPRYRVKKQAPHRLPFFSAINFNMAAKGTKRIIPAAPQIMPPAMTAMMVNKVFRLSFGSQPREKSH